MFTIRKLVHLVFPALRVLLLLPLLGTLSSPRVVYHSTQVHSDVEEPEPTVSSFLLPHDTVQRFSTGFNAGESSKYGTFPTSRFSPQTSAPVTRPTTPAQSTQTGPDLKVKSLAFLGDFNNSLVWQVERKSEISYNPSWSELCRRLRRITPYLWPKHSPRLQFLAVRETLFSFCVRQF